MASTTYVSVTTIGIKTITSVSIYRGENSSSVYVSNSPRTTAALQGWEPGTVNPTPLHKMTTHSPRREKPQNLGDPSAEQRGLPVGSKLPNLLEPLLLKRQSKDSKNGICG